jgi:tRNA(adenine34) deaminase
MDLELLMAEAIAQARWARAKGEVPIGAVVVMDNRVIARGHNQTERLNDSTAHAEIIALTSAFNHLGSKYLPEATLYVTIEPCLMCVGALVHARVGTLVYGAAEPRSGAIVSTVAAGALPGHNHRFDVVTGVREPECRELMQEFFRARR